MAGGGCGWLCHVLPHWDGITVMLWPEQTRPGLRSSAAACVAGLPVKPPTPHDSAMEPLPLLRRVDAASSVRGGGAATWRVALARGEPLCVSLPNERTHAQRTAVRQDRQKTARKSRASPPHPDAKPSGRKDYRKTMRPGMERQETDIKAAQQQRSRGGTPMPDSTAELPPMIRRPEMVAIALVGLLLICRHRRALFRKGLLPPGRDGVRGRHHAVAGGGLPRALSHSARRWARC